MPDKNQTFINYGFNLKKSLVQLNFVRSDKVWNFVRPMSDKTPEYLDSTVGHLLAISCVDGINLCFRQTT